MTSTPLVSSAGKSPQVSVIGAGRVGSTLAQRIAEKNIANVVLLDIVEGLPQGIALDLMQARGVEGHDRQIIGTNDYTQTAGSDIIVITAGLPRKPGMLREDLIKINAKIVTQAAQNTIAQSPNAMVIVVTNPLDVMTYLAWKVTKLPSSRVMGMSGVLDSSRFQTFIAMELGVSPQDVQTLVLGDHGKLMVPLSRYCTVRGIPLTQLLPQEKIAEMGERTRNGGAEIIELMKNSSAYFAPASSASFMVEAILWNRSRVAPVSAYLNGEYGLHDIFLSVPCQLGGGGVEKVLELELTDDERNAFLASAQSVRENIEFAQTLTID